MKDGVTNEKKKTKKLIVNKKKTNRPGASEDFKRKKWQKYETKKRLVG